MKTVRKRAIVKSMKKHATKLVDKYSSIEQARICCGIGIAKPQEETELHRLMDHYGEMVLRLYPRDYRAYPYTMWWAEEITNGI